MELEKAINNLNFIVVTDVYDNEVRIDKTKVVNEYNESVGVVLQYLTKQDKMIDKMADEILELNTMIVEKGEFFSVVPMWLGKEHIIEYFKGITNKKAEESE